MPAALWERPTGEEVREVSRLARFSGGQAAKVPGPGSKGNRAVRHWSGGDSAILHAASALLCNFPDWLPSESEKTVEARAILFRGEILAAKFLSIFS
jgi:hypothetical protein